MTPQEFRTLDTLTLAGQLAQAAFTTLNLMPGGPASPASVKQSRDSMDRVGRGFFEAHGRTDFNLVLMLAEIDFDGRVKRARVALGN